MAIAEITRTVQYLTFNLGEEEYAVEVADVREVLDVLEITKIPQAPDFMRGVINVRGSVVPVIDMRLKFGMSETETGVDTCIIVTEVSCDGGTTILGMLADSVQEVIELEPEQIEPAPKIGGWLRADFLKGIGKRNDRFILILDIDRVFTTEELILVKETGR